MARVSRLVALPKRKAEFIEPMECAPVTKLLDGPGWVYEIKLDGYRAIAVKSDRVVSLFSRRHKSFNHQYPHLVEALGELPEDTVVDEKLLLWMILVVQISTCSHSSAAGRRAFTISSSTSLCATTATLPDWL